MSAEPFEDDSSFWVKDNLIQEGPPTLNATKTQIEERHSMLMIRTFLVSHYRKPREPKKRLNAFQEQ